MLRLFYRFRGADKVQSNQDVFVFFEGIKAFVGCRRFGVSLLLKIEKALQG